MSIYYTNGTKWKIQTAKYMAMLVIFNSQKIQANFVFANPIYAYKKTELYFGTRYHIHILLLSILISVFMGVQ